MKLLNHRLKIPFRTPFLWEEVKQPSPVSLSDASPSQRHRQADCITHVRNTLSLASFLQNPTRKLELAWERPQHLYTPSLSHGSPSLTDVTQAVTSLTSRRSILLGGIWCKLEKVLQDKIFRIYIPT